MYLGRLVEIGPTDRILAHPDHPYTRSLLAAVPRPDPAAKRPRVRLRGELPSPINIPPGCPFHPRCPEALPECSERVPRLEPVGEGHHVACHLYPAAR